jgi:putative endonuclease
MLARIIFALLDWGARRGLTDTESVQSGNAKRQARQTGIRGETYAYWYLRRQGYVLVARNYMVPGLKGEIDLVGYDGPTLAFIEVKTRSAGIGDTSMPEDAITTEKRRVLRRIAQRYLAERKLHRSPWRFDVLAIESRPGRRPLVRLHKGAFS